MEGGRVGETDAVVEGEGGEDGFEDEEEVGGSEEEDDEVEDGEGGEEVPDEGGLTEAGGFDVLSERQVGVPAIPKIVLGFDTPAVAVVVPPSLATALHRIAEDHVQGHA